MKMADPSTGDTSDPTARQVGEVEVGNIVVAELADRVCQSIDRHNEEVGAEMVNRSWVFRLMGWGGRTATGLFGLSSVLVLVAMVACIPILQLLSLGYLLEVSGRIGRGGKFRDAMVGMEKASVLGGVLLGSWLSLIPLQIVSNFWYDAHLISPLSNQTQLLRIVQVVLLVVTFGHLFSAIVCGGKLRYFVWPLVAPLSFGVWATRRMSGLPIFKTTMQVLLGWCARGVVNDICEVKPMSDWFVPAILWKRVRAGRIYSRSRNAVWEFAVCLRLPYYLGLGGKGFVGTAIWLFVPSILFVLAGQTSGVPSLLLVIGGFFTGVPIFGSLLFLQTHFSTDGKL